MTVDYLTEFRFYQQHSELFGYAMRGHLMFLRFSFTKSVEQNPIVILRVPPELNSYDFSKREPQFRQPCDEVAPSVCLGSTLPIGLGLPLEVKNRSGKSLFYCP